MAKVKSIETFRVPDFVGPDGTRYTDIEITVISENSDQLTARLAETASSLVMLQRSGEK